MADECRAAFEAHYRKQLPQADFTNRMWDVEYSFWRAAWDASRAALAGGAEASEHVRMLQATTDPTRIRINDDGSVRILGPSVPASEPRKIRHVSELCDPCPTPHICLTFGCLPRPSDQPAASPAIAVTERYCREASIAPPAGMPPCDCSPGACTVAAGLTCRCNLNGKPWSPEACPIHRPTRAASQTEARR